MNLTTEQKLATNMKVARDMWPDASICGADRGMAALVNSQFTFNIFDDIKPDLNKAVEFYGLNTVRALSSIGKEWKCGRGRPDGFQYFDESMPIAQQQAVAAASGANQTKEDE